MYRHIDSIKVKEPQTVLKNIPRNVIVMLLKSVMKTKY